MMRVRLLVLAIAFSALSAISADAADWATVKGQVVFPSDKAIPKREAAQRHAGQGSLPVEGRYSRRIGHRQSEESRRQERRRLAASQRQGSEGEVHQGADPPGRREAEGRGARHHQPCCMFVKRITLARVGDTIIGEEPGAGAAQLLLVEQQQRRGQHDRAEEWRSTRCPNALVAESPPIQYKCTIHGWMTGYVRIFEHPYYAVTDADGKFEIKNAPVGKYRIVYWHENGFRGGAAGSLRR